MFLHHSSNHPKSVFKAIVYGQGITVRSICSKEEYIVRHLKNLSKKFKDRGYPYDLVEENLRRGISIPREDLLKPKPVYPHQACPTLPTKPKFSPTFIITYNPHNPKLQDWLRETHKLLLEDQKMKKIYPHYIHMIYT